MIARAALRKVDWAGWPALAIACLPFAAVMVANLGYVPLFDGLQYAECVVGALQPGRSLAELNCGGHVSIGYFGWLALWQLPSVGSGALIVLANAALGLFALVAFYRILSIAFPEPERRLERLVLTAALGVQPAFLASAINPTPDFGLTAALLGVIWALLSDRFKTAAALGLQLCLCKEPGVGHYLIAIGLHTLVTVTRPSGELRAKLGALRKRWALLLPPLLFAAFMAWKLKAGGGLWRDTAVREPLLHQLLSFKLLDRAFVDYLQAIFALSFLWVPSLVIAAALLLGASRWAFGLPPRDRPSARVLIFLQVAFVAVAMLVTRYLSWFNLRYVLPTLPLLLIVFAGALRDLLRSRAIRLVAACALFGLFAISAFRTVDPLSIRLRGTFAFGQHRLLDMREGGGLGGASKGRDELFYNLQITALHDLQNEAYRTLRPDADRAIVIPYELDWFFVGRIDPNSHQRTLRPLEGTDRAAYGRGFEPVTNRKLPSRLKEDGYLGIDALAGLREPPRTIYLLRAPNVPAERDLGMVQRTYREVRVHRFGSGGYELLAHELVRR